VRPRCRRSPIARTLLIHSPSNPLVTTISDGLPTYSFYVQPKTFCFFLSHFNRYSTASGSAARLRTQIDDKDEGRVRGPTRA
jgi:hypothetical protein